MNYEVRTNSLGQERVFEKISHNKIRITGESLVSISDASRNGSTTMFDFENGPHLNVGGVIKFLNSKWKIRKIVPEEMDKENLSSVLLEVDLNY